jgi:hypothetical protein
LLTAPQPCADPDLAQTVHRFIEEDVHHVAVFVKQRGLEHARAAFSERHVAVELANQLIQHHHMPGGSLREEKPLYI